jgi:hypothetical protein
MLCGRIEIAWSESRSALTVVEILAYFLLL